MKFNEITENIGKKCKVLPYGDLGMERRYRKYLHTDKEPVEIIRKTKGGLILCKDKDGLELIFPFRNLELLEKNNL